MKGIDPLAVDNVHRAFGSTRALDGASFRVGPGECVGLLGPNGAGKTTLIKAICGRVRLDQGTVAVLGHHVNAGARYASGEDRHATKNGAASPSMGLVPQDVALYPLLTARENLEVFGRLHGVSPESLEQVVTGALEFTALAERANDKVKTFSGGMKRRLNIACAVLHKPRLVLLDEPTVGVDPQSRERIWQMLADLRSGGTSILLTTHQLDEAQHVCDRIVIIDHGRIVAEGTLEELITRTIGSARTVRIAVRAGDASALARALAGLGDFERGDASGGARGDGGVVTARMTDIGRELPSLLSQVTNGGGVIEDIAIEAPSLQAVFIHLTGRELRE